ncbi:MAG TPA: VOC family protein [Candidatus Polarisedimenticolia bacterium]|nr:VOC family protein [Candidatus Polarisedimenticolia bacterium]
MKRVAHVDHIQLAAPKGYERAAREFYGSILGLQEVEKPLALHARGGCWFQCDKQQVHIGVEPGFHPAKKAHPAFVVFSLDELQQALLARGIGVVDGEDLPERRRFFANDPWGKRIEFVELAALVRLLFCPSSA